jgi:hypothetical protein
MILPMPLKHFTETVLVVVLGGAVLLTGAIVGILPPLSQSIIPWLIAFILSLVYPLALYPMLRSRRADYPFRVLHFAPAFMLLLWLALDLLASVLPGAWFFRSLVVWGWAAIIVLVMFLLLAAFCLQVIRQRTSRLTFLAILLVPFIAFGVLSEHYRWRDQVASAVWPRLGIGSGTIVAAVPDDLRNTQPSQNPDEEQWRAQMRRMDRRNERLKTESGELSSMLNSAPAQSSSVPLFVGLASSSSSSLSSVRIAAVLSSSSVAWNAVSSAPRSSAPLVVATWSSASSLSSVAPASAAPWYQWFLPQKSSSSAASVPASSSSSSRTVVASKPPPRLSSSGPGEVAGMGVLFAAAYCGVLHRRILKRRA